MFSTDISTRRNKRSASWNSALLRNGDQSSSELEPDTELTESLTSNEAPVEVHGSPERPRVRNQSMQDEMYKRTVQMRVYGSLRVVFVRGHRRWSWARGSWSSILWNFWILNGRRACIIFYLIEHGRVCCEYVTTVHFYAICTSMLVAYMLCKSSLASTYFGAARKQTMQAGDRFSMGMWMHERICNQNWCQSSLSGWNRDLNI